MSDNVLKLGKWNGKMSQEQFFFSLLTKIISSIVSDVIPYLVTSLVSFVHFLFSCVFLSFLTSRVC